MQTKEEIFERFVQNKERVGLPELYKFYKETLIYKGKRFRSKHLEFKDKHRFIIDRKTFSNIIKDFNKEIARLIIDENMEFRMPANLGTIRIRKYKKILKFNEDGTIIKKYLGIDWPATIKHWGELYPDKTEQEIRLIKGKPRLRYLNEHTDGYVFKLYWNKHRCAIVNKRFYRLVLSRTNKRRIAYQLKNNSNANYYE